jgi:hypothetical protein
MYTVLPGVFLWTFSGATSTNLNLHGSASYETLSSVPTTFLPHQQTENLRNTVYLKKKMIFQTNKT